MASTGAPCELDMNTPYNLEARGAELFPRASVAGLFENPCGVRMGIDVGSTTVKLAVLDAQGQLVYANYQRHHTDIRACARELFERAQEALGELRAQVAITGSGGLLLAQWLGLEFVQEVIASKRAIETLIPQTDVAIELGGEDAKIIYFAGGIEQRMNGTCAGGTGAFIDQMASLLHTDAAGLNTLAEGATHIYPIASRCGVFAKSDVQPLLNEGAAPEDVAASIFQSVANQTVSGLACGHPIRGNVAFLGGPLQYLPQLRERFYETLNLAPEARIVPVNAHLFVAIGAALAATQEATYTLSELIAKLAALKDTQGSEVERLAPLFEDEASYQEFCERHARDVVPRASLEGYHGQVYLGIDAGSTTMKAAMVGEGGELLRTWYGNNNGDIIGCAQVIMEDFYGALPEGVTIGHVTTTGYGEALLQAALAADSGEIETVAHLRGAQAFVPDVDFILDIGGQDMKCLRVSDGVIEHIMLNEACSSGCGSFIESFASAMGLTVEEFAAAALKATAPVDLGSRCTVFMNSRVKQAQKEGATVGDIAAGLSYSVIKNALFKVIKLRDASQAGQRIVVQGGTFMSDATLRAFELLLGRDAIRPDIAGVMGAYGAALIARDRAQAAAAEKNGEVVSSLLSREEIANLAVKHTHVHCGRCQNNCLLTVSTFGGGRRFITGNRCERGAGGAKVKTAGGKGKSAAAAAAATARPGTPAALEALIGSDTAPNLFAYKQQLLFDRPSLDAAHARATIGIPRALNMYENYPFWHTFFTQLGFAVVPSDPSTKATYEAGIESMPSESVCYPAKLSHGHVQNLLAKDVDAIWMPCVRWERQEDPAATNHYNCPIVMSYPQALELNVDELATSRTLYCCPFVPYDDKRELKRRLYEEVVEKLLPQVQARRAAAAAAGVAAAGDAAAGVAEKCGEAAGVTAGSEGAAGAAAAAGDVAPAASQPEALLGVESRAFEPLTRAEIDAAVNAAWEEDQRFKQAMRDAGDACLAWIECHDGHGIVLAGRPYHQDPEVNHAIPELIHGFGFAVLTEDSVAHKTPVERPIRVVDQWMYHSRLYRAARFVAGRNDLDLIQLNSFGCGLDALTCDQVQEILEASGKIYTVLKIDEVSNLGACRIRVRSLMAALANQKAELAAATPAGEEPPREREAASAAVTKVRYTKEMREEGYTILCPQMAPIHFELVEPIVRRAGYNLVLLPSVDAGAVEAGLKYVNNDICYPSILVTGQIMEAIESGQYDLNRTAVLITQTGGGCRATNYIALIRKALKESGHANVPVVSLAVAAGLDEKNPGFKLLTPDVLIHACYALLYGDLIMQALYRTRPYEASPGEANALYRWFMDRAARDIPTMTPAAFYRLCDETVHAFDTLPLVDDRSKPRVGVVGEILVKFHPTANNQVVEVIEREGCEAVVPGLVDFFLFGLTSPQNTKDELGSSAKKRLTHNAAISFIEGLRAPINQLLEKSERFEPYVSIWDLASEANEVLSLCNTMGEGWLLTAEMIDLIKTGTPNIVCASPFACLPNHVVGKSVIKRLKQLYPAANIVAIDYDPGASEVNQLNRIKLMISVAQERANDAATAPAEKNREVEALV